MRDSWRLNSGAARFVLASLRHGRLRPQVFWDAVSSSLARPIVARRSICQMLFHRHFCTLESWPLSDEANLPPPLDRPAASLGTSGAE